MADRMDLVLGIVMIVLGILVITGNLTLGPLVWVAAILLIVAGVLMILGRLPGGTIVGVLAIVLGALLLVPEKGVIPGEIASVLHLVIGVLLLVYGILKVMGKQGVTGSGAAVGNRRR